MFGARWADDDISHADGLFLEKAAGRRVYNKKVNVPGRLAHYHLCVANGAFGQ